jgi:transcriptional regulator with PAS, ATPase and Fis domain
MLIEDTTGAVRFERAEGDQLVGNSAQIEQVRKVARLVAPRHSTVMILGETGSGKEMLAQYIHANSRRSHKPFVPVDCSSLAEGLFESELFGHVRGAFSGAVRDSLGFIRSADGGTLFLDEIGELSLSLQAKLLRVLQERKVCAVGDTRWRPVNVRVICATNRDLKQMVADGTFRQDLYYRLDVVRLELPPLRNRLEDVVPLAEHFLMLQAEGYEEPFKQLDSGARAALRSYNWPGNVRELANVMERAFVMAMGERIQLDDLPKRLRQASPLASRLTESLLGTLEQAERIAIVDALKQTGQCKAAASRMLGIHVQKLRRRMIRLGL